jgi:hypothetical protein
MNLLWPFKMHQSAKLQSGAFSGAKVNNNIQKHDAKL